MKKILFLLLLSVASYGQTSTGQEQEFDYGIKNNASQTVTTPTYIGTFGTDGTQGKIPSAYIAKTAAVQDSLNKKLNLPTGFLQGLQLSINADPTKFNIAAGYYVVTDFTNLVQPVVKIINYAGATGLTPAYLATANSTYVALDINGNVVSSAAPFTNADRRTLAIVGNVVHSNNTTINVTNEIKAPIVASTNQLHDFMRAIGFLNEEGNIYSPNGANLQLNKSAGKIFGLGINSFDYLNPHQLSIPTQTALTFAYRLIGGTQYANTTSIDPNNYDNAGVLTSVPVGNRWTIQRINLFQSGLSRIQYGQTVYNSFNDAVVALPTQPFVTEQNIADNAVFRCYLIVQQGTTNLTSAVAGGTAQFVPVDKFGNIIGNGSVALTYSNIVSALGYTPENVANKVTSLASPNNTTYPTTQLLKDQLDLKQDKIDLWTPISHPLNKVVKYQINGKFYIFQSNVENNTTVPKLTKGVQPFAPYIYGGSYVGVWSAGSYVVGNIVSRNSTLYYCLTNTTTDPQLLLPPHWLKIGVDKGIYSASFIGGYSLGDAVRDVSNNVYTSQINNNTYALSTVSDNSWDIINGQPFSVAAWGDSLTLGAGSNGNANYPSVLSSIAGLNIWNGGVSGETSTQIKARFLADKDKWEMPTIIWSGRNNYTSPTTVKSDIAEMVSKLNHTNYLIIGIIKATSDAAEPINTLNSDLKTLYGDRFIDMQSYLLSIYNPAIPQDVIDHGNGVIAWSMRSDWLHLSNLGYSYVAKLINSKLNFLLGQDKINASNINTTSIQVSGNVQGLQPVKAIEVLYDDITDKGIIEAYDRVNNVVKPLSLQYPLGSELRLVEQGGTLKLGVIPTYSAGSMKQLGVTTATLGTVQYLPSGTIGKLSKWVESGVQGDSFFTETSNQISLPAGVGFSVGGNTFSVPPSPTQGVFNILGSDAQFLTFSTQSYIYNSSSLFRLLSVSDIDFVAGGSQRLHISSITGKSAFTSTVTASPAILDTELATLGQAKAVARPYKVYTALLSQAGTSAPTATVLENTLGGTVVWTRSNTGQYVGTLTGAFTDQKTIIFVNRSNPAATAFDTNMAANVININTVGYTTFSNSAYVDGQTNSASIEIRVYN